MRWSNDHANKVSQQFTEGQTDVEMWAFFKVQKSGQQHTSHTKRCNKHKTRIHFFFFKRFKIRHLSASLY